MGVGLTAPVHSAAEGEGGDTNGHEAAWRADRPPSRTRRQRRVHTGNTSTESVPTDRGVTSNTCVCCAYRPTPSRIIASSRRQPSRNRISGMQSADQVGHSSSFQLNSPFEPQNPFTCEFLGKRRSSELEGTALGKCLRAWSCMSRSWPADVAQSRHAFVGGTVST